MAVTLLNTMVLSRFETPWLSQRGCQISIHTSSAMFVASNKMVEDSFPWQIGCKPKKEWGRMMGVGVKEGQYHYNTGFDLVLSLRPPGSGHTKKVSIS